MTMCAGIPSEGALIPIQIPPNLLTRAKAKKPTAGHVTVDSFIHMSYLDPGNHFKLTPKLDMASQQFASGQGQRLFQGSQMINICTFNTRSLRNYLKNAWGPSFLKRSFDLLGLSEVQAGFKDLYNIPALRTCSLDYSSMFWNSSDPGPEEQNNYGYAGVSVFCRRRPNHVFFGFDSGLEPSLDSDGHGRLISLVFLDCIVFYVYDGCMF